MNKEFMQKAIELSQSSVESGGGPFGAVVVRNNEIIACGANRVTIDNDPTAHAEVTAIRAAARKLNSFNLQDCEIYTSCEPCPMCLGAIYWARIKKIYYANTRDDAAEIGFSDAFIYDQIPLAPNKRNLPTMQLMRNDAISVFAQWRDKAEKIEY